MRQFERWTIAYRNKRTDYLPEDLTTSFKCIPNTWRYWRADPFLMEHDGHTFLFAELYDRIFRKGVIGCCELRETGATAWRVVLAEHFHLSYPHVFKHENVYYMIPESYMGGRIALYEAVHFPWEWKLSRFLKKDYVAVDSTILEAEERQWLITLQFADNHEYLRLIDISDGPVLGEGLLISKDDQNKRPAGNLIMYQGRLLRPAQDCTISYGCVLNFYEVTEISDTAYQERLIAKIRPEDIRSDFSGTPCGIHTYNTSERYEVVDIKDYEIDLLFYVLRPFWFVFRRVRRFSAR